MTDPHKWPIMGAADEEFEAPDCDLETMERYIEALAEAIIRSIREQGHFDALRRN